MVYYRQQQSAPPKAQSPSVGELRAQLIDLVMEMVSVRDKLQGVEETPEGSVSENKNELPPDM